MKTKETNGALAGRDAEAFFVKWRLTVMNPAKRIGLYYIPILLSALVVTPWSASAWSNGPRGNATTNRVEECDNPPYSTHDWIADHALALLPDDEKAWLVPHRTMYLLGTEAPDNRRIPDACEAPHNGYDDRNRGPSVHLP